MTKILIIETANISKNSTIAHVRNAVELCRYLNVNNECDIIDLTYKFNSVVQYDIILFSYATGRADFSEIDKLIQAQHNVKIGWITNEFELFANDYIKKNITFMINNFEESGIKKAHRHNQLLTTNLNTLIVKPRNSLVHKKYDCCYYGTYRKYRVKYFQKYFQKDFILSTSKKNWKRFLDCDIDCNVVDKFSWVDEKETLNLFTSSLYIEDTKTHDCFNYMANRFFEALFCNTAVFFDRTCINTINKDIYKIDDYFCVNSYEELINKTKNIDKNKVEQFINTNINIALNEKNKTLKEIDSFLNTL